MSTAAAAAADANAALRDSSVDPSTQSNAADVVVTNYHLELDVDFGARQLRGSVLLDAKVQSAGADALLLDTRDLNIASVRVDGADADFTLLAAAARTVFGRALRVALPPSARRTPDARVRVFIAYSTSPSSSAVQWLRPQQTLSRQHPFMYTQCQAIHARSLLPCQDSPAVKSTYTAAVRVPAPLVALMSALPTQPPKTVDHGAALVYTFKQDVPIASYLLALAVGELESRAIGPRSAVWAEPDAVQRAADEFSDTEKFVAAAEEVCGSKYAWHRYDLLCLPPSFPYGGMENPCITFVTPTLLAGDKSLANVVAHEIAHSWTGNLVTSRTWQHFWLNEGFTVYVERKILARVLGEPHAHFHALLGWKHLQDDVDRLGADSPLTKLCVQLDGIDPDDAFSSVPYEKGFNLLFYLETLLGRERFEAFFQRWIAKHSLSTVTTAMFVSSVQFELKDDVDLLNKIDWDAWLHQPGMPPAAPAFDTSLYEAVVDAASDWLAQSHASPANLAAWPSTKALQRFSSTQKVAFLDQLLLHKHKLSADAVRNLQAEQFGIAASGNAEIRFRFCSVGIAAELDEIVPLCEAFLGEQGRMKFVRPLYRQLFNSSFGRQAALDAFNRLRGSYHNIAAKMIERDLQLAKSSA